MIFHKNSGGGAGLHRREKYFKGGRQRYAGACVYVKLLVAVMFRKRSTRG